MSTVIVHGTFDRDGTWWRVLGTGGFLDAVAEGMGAGGTQSDIWTVGGAHVSRYQALQVEDERSVWSGRKRAPFQHINGCFRWTGGDYHGIGRMDGGEELARYLNALAALRPAEPINLIAHSHGCNVVKVATQHLSPQVRLQAIAFLAAPHFTIAGRTPLTCLYRLNPQRFPSGVRPVLNVFDSGDRVQQGLADRFADLGLPPGLPGASWLGFSGTPVVDAHRRDPDSAARRLYDDVEVARAVGAGFLSGIQRHGALHGVAIGRLVGYWLAVWPQVGGRDCCRALGVQVV